jgi:hypothetical protein
MAYTLEDFARDSHRHALERLTPHRFVQQLPPEERLRGLPPEERVRGLRPEDLRKLKAYLDELEARGEGPDAPE